MSDQTIAIALNDDGAVVDHTGKIVDVSPYTKNILMAKGGCMKLVHTKTGKTQWRHVDISVFDSLTERTIPLEAIDNRTDDVQINVEQYIQDSAQYKPKTLIISDLKWKYLMRSVVRGKNIMMTGPSGCGKTLAVQSIANVLSDRKFFFFNMGSTSDPRSSLIGNTHYNKERGTYVAEALFVKAIQQPNAIIMLDEITRANPDAWNILITVLDENQRYLRIDERPDTPTIKVAKGVTFIATANIGTEYTATRVLDRAMTDRFSVIVEMEPLSAEDEHALLTNAYPDMKPAVIDAISDIAGHTRQQIKSEDPKISTIISSRSTMELAGLMFDGFTLEESAEVAIYPLYSNTGGIDSERTYMKQLVQKYLYVDQDADTKDSTPWSSLSQEL